MNLKIKNYNKFEVGWAFLFCQFLVFFYDIVLQCLQAVIVILLVAKS